MAITGLPKKSSAAAANRIMDKLDEQYPGYGFAAHKGYVTRSHEKSLSELGVSEVHRRSYANIAALINS